MIRTIARRTSLLLAGTTLAFLLSACGGSKDGGSLLKDSRATDDSPAPASTAAPTARATVAATPVPPTGTPAAEVPKLSARSTFYSVTRSSTGVVIVALAAEIKNESSRTVQGAKVTFAIWDDWSQTIGSRVYDLPRIGAGETFTLTNAAFSQSLNSFGIVLTGQPAKFVPTIATPGTLVDRPSGKLDPKIAAITQTQISETLYSLTGSVTLTEPTPPASIRFVSILVKDAAGATVNTVVGETTLTGLPNPIPAGTALRFSATLASNTKPAGADAFASVP